MSSRAGHFSTADAEVKIQPHLYFAVWIGFYTALEWLFSMKGMYVYDHGWNNWLNIPLNALLFIILAVHYKRPALALLLAVPIGVLFYVCFPFPLDSLK